MTVVDESVILVVMSMECVDQLPELSFARNRYHGGEVV